MRQTTFDVAEFLRAGQLVVFESTAYPGAAEQLVLPILEKANSAHLRVSRNTGKSDEIFLAYFSRAYWTGEYDAGRSKAAEVYCRDRPIQRHSSRGTVSNLLRAHRGGSSASTAELIGVFESVYQAVNTALANELKQVCLRMGITRGR